MTTRFKIDLIKFFKWFFNYYVKELNLHDNYEYIFIIKDIGYRYLFDSILKEYKNVQMLFLKKNKSDGDLIEKNKDDFICNYLYVFYKIQGKDVVLISNDKYRDLNTYYKHYENKVIESDFYTQNGFNKVSIKVNDIILSKLFEKNEKKSIDKQKLKYLDYY